MKKFQKKKTDAFKDPYSQYKNVRVHIPMTDHNLNHHARRIKFLSYGILNLHRTNVFPRVLYSVSLTWPWLNLIWKSQGSSSSDGSSINQYTVHRLGVLMLKN